MVLAENEELSEKEKVGFMIQQLSCKMYFGKSKLLLSIPYNTYKQLKQEDSDLLGKHAKTFITLLATTPYKDLVKLAKPKYIIKLVSNSKSVTYVGQVKDGEVSTIITKYYRTIKPEKAMVFGNKENAENFIKNNLNPNRKFEVITK